MARRKRLSFWVFLIAGILIAGYSWIVRASLDTANEEAMTFLSFFYVGLVFIVIGLLKLLFKRSSSAGKGEKQFAERLGGVDKIDKTEAELLKEKREKLKANSGDHFGNVKSRKKSGSQGDGSQQQQAQEQSPRQDSQQPHIIFCPNCGAKNYSTSNFCHMCGNSLK